MRVRVVLGVALALVAIAVVVALSQRGDRLAGTNFVHVAGVPVELPGGRRACQVTRLVDDAQRVELFVDTGGRRAPSLDVTFTDPGGAIVARGNHRAGADPGEVVVTLDRRVDGNHSATFCVRNEGARRIGLGGAPAAPDAAATIGRRPTAGVIAARYLRPGRETWWDLLPTIASRFGIGKAPVFGAWTLPVAALLLLAAWAGAIRLLLRGSGS
ncbi:hypothetical protein [Conexibacter arvalis]|uniref:Uncharacterized protein n=1 Tax=Conexibacter arvalis TaxID=912552 RepID=A0A840I9C7_9ACTN|nr:hypothetical protein [Conexibacter arvalis]MBB4661517.1 hypothetical protein [Conexibacter arvalis]